MRRLLFTVVVSVVAIGLCAGICFSGGSAQPRGMVPAPLDPVLMGFKEQGVWYFLCEAPIYYYRIPPHYQTVAPPPPPCPVPLVPAPAPRAVK